MNATAVTADANQQPAARVDHAALDVILSHLERRYGLDPRIDRAYRIVVSDRVDLSVVDPRVALVHGDSGRSYWATVDGFCECPDAERVARCKHSLAVLIAVQLAAVAKLKAAKDDDDRATFARLTREHQAHGRELIAAGTRPIDDATYRERDDRIQALRLWLPAWWGSLSACF
jgi:hypothetical protein